MVPEMSMISNQLTRLTAREVLLIMGWDILIESNSLGYRVVLGFIKTDLTYTLGSFRRTELVAHMKV
jgi:hypothetical protein